MVTRRNNAVIRWLLGLVVLGVAAYVLIFREDSSAPPVSFKTARVTRGPVEETVTATGAVNAVVTVQVGTQVSGTIQKLGADFNSIVKAGDVIAQIDPTRFRANVEQANAALKAAQAAAARARVTASAAKVERSRAEDLAGRGALGQSEVDAARAKHEQAEAEVASTEAQVAQARASVGVARVDLERATIRAPISGVVLQRAVDVGQTVAASLSSPTLFTIAQDLSQMEVRAAIDEADVGKLKESQDARFQVDAFPGQEFSARLHQIRSQPNVLQNVVTYDAILRFENAEGKLRPGMTATVRLVTQQRDNVLRMPNAALRFKPSSDLIEGGGSAPGPGAGPRAARAAEGKGPRGEKSSAEAMGAVGGAARQPVDGAKGSGRPPGAGPLRAAKAFRVAGSKVAPVSFVPGIASDEFTEIVSGDIKEGDEFVIEALGGAKKPAGDANPMRGRGPRFF